MDSSSASESSGFAALTVSLIVVCVLFPMFATLAVGLRFFTRRKFSISVKADDWIILPALVDIYRAVCGGVGGPSHDLTPDEAIILAKITYAVAIVYPAALPVIKFSILLFYKRLFPGRHFRLLQYCIGVFILVCWISEEFATIFQCTPISANWTPGGICIAEAAMDDILSAANVFTDIFILAMPWPILLKLQVTKQKKIQLLGIFLLGSFACLAGIMSFVYVVLDGKSSTQVNLSHFTGYLFIWFSLETNVGIICACLPAISPLWLQPSPLSRSLTSFKSYLKTTIPLHRLDESTSRKSSHSTFIFRANSDAGLMSENASANTRDKSASPIDMSNFAARDLEAYRARQEFLGCAVIPKGTVVHEADGSPPYPTDSPNEETALPNDPQELADCIPVPIKTRGQAVHEMPTIVEFLPLERAELRAPDTIQEPSNSSRSVMPAVIAAATVHEVQGIEVHREE
ncbi:hypothetical protein MMC11_003629 [Xylographa trunciseda]|nr:hypothetical protein [Xylographa trunciseda]